MRVDPNDLAIAGNAERRAAPAEVPEPRWKVRKLQAIGLADHPDAGRLDYPADRPAQAYLSGSAVRLVDCRRLAGHLDFAGSCVRLTCFPLSF